MDVVIINLCYSWLYGTWRKGKNGSDAISEGRKSVSVVLKLLVIASAAIGTILSAYAGRHSFMGAWWILVLPVFLLLVGYGYLMLARVMGA